VERDEEKLSKNLRKRKEKGEWDKKGSLERNEGEEEKCLSKFHKEGQGLVPLSIVRERKRKTAATQQETADRSYERGGKGERERKSLNRRVKKAREYLTLIRAN